MPSIWNAVSHHPHQDPEKGHSLSPRRQHYQERNGIHTVISEHTENKGFAAGLEFKLEVLNRDHGQPPPHWQRSLQQPTRKEESPVGQGSPLGKASIQMANLEIKESGNASISQHQHQAASNLPPGTKRRPSGTLWPRPPFSSLLILGAVDMLRFCCLSQQLLATRCLSKNH